jgi:hypothetical protein
MSVAVAAEPGVNALDYPGPAWSPYVVGAGIGVLSWLTFYFSDKPIGASSFYAQVRASSANSLRNAIPSRSPISKTSRRA